MKTNSREDKSENLSSEKFYHGTKANPKQQISLNPALIQTKFVHMKIISFFLLLILISCHNNNTEAQEKQPWRTPPSQLTVKHEFNSIILDGFCDSTEMVKIMDSLMIERNISWCHGFRSDSAFELFYRNRQTTKEENDYLWKNYLGQFSLNKTSGY